MAVFPFSCLNIPAHIIMGKLVRVCVCVYHILSLHPVMNTLKCFCTLALLNNTAVNMHMHLFHEETGFVSWDIYPEVGVFDHLVVLLSIF